MRHLRLGEYLAEKGICHNALATARHDQINFNQKNLSRVRSEVTPNLENERLRRENAALRSALKATNRITAHYADDPPTARRRGANSMRPKPVPLLLASREAESSQRLDRFPQ
jgi:hypothetical protein